MLWTVIGYRLELDDKTLKEFPFTKTFYGSHDGMKAIEDATKLFKENKVMVVAVVAGDHKTSTYIKNHK
jgi:hypothetical protein